MKEPAVTYNSVELLSYRYCMFPELVKERIIVIVH